MQKAQKPTLRFAKTSIRIQKFQYKIGLSIFAELLLNLLPKKQPRETLIYRVVLKKASGRRTKMLKHILEGNIVNCIFGWCKKRWVDFTERLWYTERKNYIERMHTNNGKQ